MNQQYNEWQVDDNVALNRETFHRKVTVWRK